MKTIDILLIIGICFLIAEGLVVMTSKPEITHLYSTLPDWSDEIKLNYIELDRIIKEETNLQIETTGKLK